MKSTDRGRTWTSISGDLPQRSGAWSDRAGSRERQPAVRRAWSSASGSPSTAAQHWVQLKGGIPTTQARDLAIQKRENDLVRRLVRPRRLRARRLLGAARPDAAGADRGRAGCSRCATPTSSTSWARRKRRGATQATAEPAVRRAPHLQRRPGARPGRQAGADHHATTRARGAADGAAAETPVSTASRGICAAIRRRGRGWRPRRPRRRAGRRVRPKTRTREQEQEQPQGSGRGQAQGPAGAGGTLPGGARPRGRDDGDADRAAADLRGDPAATVISRIAMPAAKLPGLRDVINSTLGIRRRERSRGCLAFTVPHAGDTIGAQAQHTFRGELSIARVAVSAALQLPAGRVPAG